MSLEEECRDNTNLNYDKLIFTPLPDIPNINENNIITILNKQKQRDKQFLDIKVPKIKPNTILDYQPLLLLRTFAVSENNYDINDLINRIIKYDKFNSNDDDFKLKVIYEIASNERLKKQIDMCGLFDKWIEQANNITYKSF